MVFDGTHIHLRSLYVAIQMGDDYIVRYRSENGQVYSYMVIMPVIHGKRAVGKREIKNSYDFCFSFIYKNVIYIIRKNNNYIN